MPGLAPKDPSLRARRNKSSTAAKLRVVDPSEVEVPELPDRLRETDEGDFVPVSWHPRTLDWWETVWASPMAAEWLEADRPGLVLLAELWDDFYKASGASDRLKLSAELRLQEARFGLAPMDRRRLQWEVERSEDAQDRGRLLPARGRAARGIDGLAAVLMEGSS